MCCLLVEQNPDCFPWLHSAPDDSDQFRPNEILILFCIWSTSFSSGKRWHWTRSRSCLNIHWPVWVYILCVLQFLEGFYGATHITFPCGNKSKSPASQIGEEKKEKHRKIKNQILLQLFLPLHYSYIILTILDLQCINYCSLPFSDATDYKTSDLLKITLQLTIQEMLLRKSLKAAVSYQKTLFAVAITAVSKHSKQCSYFTSCPAPAYYHHTPPAFMLKWPSPNKAGGPKYFRGSDTTHYQKI